MHERGFGGASVRDIVEAAGVPQGSFTNHFASKEAFGLEIIELYFARSFEVMRATLRNDQLPPLERLGAYIDAAKARLSKDNMRNGCLFGNFTAEASDHSEVIRRRLIEIFAEVQELVAYCLRAAVKAGELPPDFDCDEVAGFGGLVDARCQSGGKGAAQHGSGGPFQEDFLSQRCCADLKSDRRDAVDTMGRWARIRWAWVSRTSANGDVRCKHQRKHVHRPMVSTGSVL